MECATYIFFKNDKKKKIKGVKPNSRNLLIAHLEINEKINHDKHYMTCYDTNFKIYRVTFYSNLRNDNQNKPYNLSCEIITDSNSYNEKKVINDVLKELKSMKVISSKSKLINSFISFKKSAVIIHFQNHINLLEIKSKFVKKY